MRYLACEEHTINNDWCHWQRNTTNNGILKCRQKHSITILNSCTKTKRGFCGDESLSAQSRTESVSAYVISRRLFTSCWVQEIISSYLFVFIRGIRDLLFFFHQRELTRGPQIAILLSGTLFLPISAALACPQSSAETATCRVKLCFYLGWKRRPFFMVAHFHGENTIKIVAWKFPLLLSLFMLNTAVS